MSDKAVAALEDDELYKLLVAGKATAEDQSFAAKWVRTLSEFITDAQYVRLRDGYEADDADEAT